MTIRVRALGEEEAAELARMVRSRTLGAGLVRRAQIVRHRQVVRLRLRGCAVWAGRLDGYAKAATPVTSAQV